MLLLNPSGTRPVTDLGACPGAEKERYLLINCFLWSSFVSTISLLAVSKSLSLNPLYRVNGT